MTESIRTGGCQCGAVRFRIHGALGRPSICHCRMCQKAFGSFFGPLVTVPKDGVEWTRTEPAYFQSSVNISRGFCGDCGTPLTFEAPDGVALAIAAFDDPSTIRPVIQWGVEAKLPYVDDVPDLPEEETMADIADAPFLADLVSYQHPDYDTDQWPAEDKS